MAKTVNIVGTLISRTVGIGSKSERTSYFIFTDDKEWKQIRVRGENAFEQPTLRALVGARCLAEACVLHGSLFIAKKVSRA